MSIIRTPKFDDQVGQLRETGGKPLQTTHEKLKEIKRMKTIYLRDLCGIQILSKGNVSKIYEVLTEDSLVIDFTDVTFISRSVADEICKMMEKYTDIVLTQMNEDVSTMLEVVRRVRTVTSKPVYRPKISVTYNCDTIEETYAALLSFGAYPFFIPQIIASKLAQNNRKLTSFVCNDN